jgi:hypothetical protein
MGIKWALERPYGVCPARRAVLWEHLRERTATRSAVGRRWHNVPRKTPAKRLGKCGCFARSTDIALESGALDLVFCWVRVTHMGDVTLKKRPVIEKNMN